MEILYLLIPVALLILGGAIAIFFWAVRSGQYDDLEGPAYRILMDDEPALEPDQNTDGEDQNPKSGRSRP